MPYSLAHCCTIFLKSSGYRNIWMIDIQISILERSSGQCYEKNPKVRRLAVLYSCILSCSLFSGFWCLDKSCTFCPWYNNCVDSVGESQLQWGTGSGFVYSIQNLTCHITFIREGLTNASLQMAEIWHFSESETASILSWSRRDESCIWPGRPVSSGEEEQTHLVLCPEALGASLKKPLSAWAP